MSRVFIIAEAGINHNGCVKTAKKLINAAVNAGVDAVKFQTFKAEKLVVANLKKAKYQIENMGTNESQFEMLKKFELSLPEHNELFAYCAGKYIVFMSSPFDEESVDMLDGLGMRIFKIPSGEITNKPLIQYIATKKKPIILSTGMSYLGEVEKAIGWINEIWRKLKEKPLLTLLHCVSNYPAAVEDVNLLAMKTLKSAFGMPVGYSDHTLGIEMPIAAVAIGARVIEKHFTLDRNMVGPDHKASLEPDELKAMVKAIRNVEQAMGNGKKRPTGSENSLKETFRRSLVAARDMRTTDTVRRADIAIKRPGVGLAPELMEQIIGRKVRVDVKKDLLFQKFHFSDI